MTSQKVVIVSEEGLHARPAAEFCKTAAGFQSRIVVQKDRENFDGKSMLMILSMGACKGDEIKITAEGADEEAAVRTLVELVEQG